MQDSGGHQARQQSGATAYQAACRDSQVQDKQRSHQHRTHTQTPAVHPEDFHTTPHEPVIQSGFGNTQGPVEQGNHKIMLSKHFLECLGIIGLINIPEAAAATMVGKEDKSTQKQQAA